MAKARLDWVEERMAGEAGCIHVPRRGIMNDRREKTIAGSGNVSSGDFFKSHKDTADVCGD